METMETTDPTKNRSPHCPDGWYFEATDINGDTDTHGPFSTYEQAQFARARLVQAASSGSEATR